MNSVMLPNVDRAVVDIAKLRDYCLNPDHEDGKHKARVFASALDLRQGDADWLRGRLLEAAVSEQAIMISKNRFGTLYVIDFLLTTSSKISIRPELLDRQDRRRFPKADDALRQDLNTFYGTDSLAFVNRINR